MSLVAFQAKNHPQQVSRRGVDDATDDRRTPDDLFDALNARFRFTLDAAASVENRRCEHYWSRDQDGLAQRWFGSVWCNPPYSNLRAWVQKAWKAVDEEGADCVVMLVPANRTEQGWWQDYVEPLRDCGLGLKVEFLRGRLRFTRPTWKPGPKGDRPPFGCCLLIFTRSGK